ncbi:unnamed protein product [Blepharisma stoltei]|uniref:acetyl-CoA C-acyltransferase n=1 Tax=Blepharisma stoltei TaxID=1481888 RepID=A0AAU9J444_9CILI|nr:unnamed protein product [Blepharisma stoltei]
MEGGARRLNIINQHLTGEPIEVVICAAFRTPLTRAKKGGLKDTPVEEMLAQLYDHVIKTTRLDKAKIEEVVIGNVLKVGSNGMGLRLAQFMSGFPDTVPCYSLNRMCASGLQSVADIANAIKAGQIKIGIAGGAESMSLFEMNSAVHPPLPERAFEIPAAANTVLPMGITSDNVVSRFGITRQKMDQMAVDSHAKAAKAQETGLFDEEIVPIKTVVKGENGEQKTITVTKDDGIRKGTTLQILGKLRPAFNPNGGTTAGNSSQVTDGAAVVLLASRQAAIENNLPILARFVSFAAVGVPPEIMGVGPAFAIPRALQLAGLTINDIDIFEINEAFASQATFSIEHLGIDKNKVNPKGGAIAFGHPLGCTGSRQVATLLPELRRTRGRYGVISMCIGSGMGAAAVIENLVR